MLCQRMHTDVAGSVALASLVIANGERDDRFTVTAVSRELSPRFLLSSACTRGPRRTLRRCDARRIRPKSCRVEFKLDTGSFSHAFTIEQKAHACTAALEATTEKNQMTTRPKLRARREGQMSAPQALYLASTSDGVRTVEAAASASTSA